MISNQEEPKLKFTLKDVGQSKVIIVFMAFLITLGSLSSAPFSRWRCPLLYVFIIEAFSNILFIWSWNNTFACVTNLKSIYKVFFFALNLTLFSVYKTGTQCRNISKEGSLLLLSCSHAARLPRNGHCYHFLCISRAFSTPVTGQRFLERKPPTTSIS